jgi:hypothetical protein
MSVVVASEAKLVVRLDVSQAEKDAERLAVVKGAAQGPQTTDRPRPVDGSGGSESSPDQAFDPSRHAAGLARAAWNGGLYQQVRATTAALPIPGLAVSIEGAELVRQHGPFGVAAARAAARHLSDDPATQAAIDQALSAATASVNELASRVDRIESIFNAIDATMTELKELAIGAAALGGVEPSELPSLAMTMHDVNQWSSQGQFVRRRRERQFLGESVGDAAGAALFDKLFAGRSIR